jgi:hypothetical protein
LFVLCFCIACTVFLYCLYCVFVLFVLCFCIVCTVFCIVCTVFCIVSFKYIYSFLGFVSPCIIIYSNKSTNQMHQSLRFIAEVACWPLVSKFAGSHPAEAVGFLWRKIPQHTFLRRGSKAVGPIS